MKIKKSGFTLAEVLITLLIIGVVASIVIPTLINDTTNSEYVTAWKKVYGTASQAYNLAVIDNSGGFGAYSCIAWGYDNSLDKYNAMKEKLNVIKNCNGNTFGNCWAPNGITPYQSAGCGEFSRNAQNNSLAFVTADGMSWLQYGNCSLMAVDINGLKPPNQWGKDAFTFTIHDKKLNPGGCEPTNNSVSFLKQ